MCLRVYVCCLQGGGDAAVEGDAGALSGGGREPHAGGAGRRRGGRGRDDAWSFLEAHPPAAMLMIMMMMMTCEGLNRRQMLVCANSSRCSVHCHLLLIYTK